MTAPEPPSNCDPSEVVDPERNDEFEPVRRDRGFLVRFVVALFVGTAAASFAGTVVPPTGSGPR